MTDCDGAELSGNQVTALRAGPGTAIKPAVVAPARAGRGGEAVGMDIRTSSDVKILDLVVDDLRGGAGGESTSQAYDARHGSGGPAFGLRLAEAPRAHLSGLDLHRISGGPSHDGSIGSGPSESGSAAGLALVDCTETNVERAAVSNVREGPPGRGDQPGFQAGGAECVRAEGVVTSTVAHLSCARAGHATGSGAGVRSTAESALIALSNSIILGVSGPCLAERESSGSPVIHITHSGLGSCDGAAAHQEAGVSLFAIGEAFADAATGDLRLLPTSAAIDAGSPTADYCAERAPNGCRVNAGRWGGTSKAIPRPESEHCACDSDGSTR